MTQGGILSITNNTFNGEPGLVLTTGDPVDSATMDAQGLGSFVVYTTKPNNADGSAGSILWRPEYVFSPQIGDDTMNTTLADVQAYSRAEADGRAASLLAGPMGLELHMPPENIGQMDDIWQVLTEGCDKLSIMWTDGKVDQLGKVKWYGIDRDSDGNILISMSGITEVESGGALSYNALWTPATVRYWPRAIKIAFYLIDPRMPEQMQEIRYEFVCEVRP